jgi:hypothetical protein
VSNTNLHNMRDLSTRGSSTGAGFQFEFYCQNCTHTWKSRFKPYRPGQLTALFGMFSSFLPGKVHLASRGVHAFADAHSRSAYDAALADAMQVAHTEFNVCPQCDEGVCNECWDGRKQQCNDCVAKYGAGGAATAAAATSAAGPKCPNCQTTSDGGRFCAECGFDMASTHKSCPGCGAMVGRQARFCTDCGHGF